ncbi:MAG TPA: phosphatidylglycerophosphatase A [Syntrophorhabdaceae bacterium]|nr:phosphatidylglycerophosphatase A [Syntrophorhabdaceae bacterium]HQH44158.1 phosphatidylglycerophosphatase A [Syntrophorhabdaceae bacterium]HQK47317.1 phosphatidylglycerophosphatase A [Syntrophorhabdaceae bacterium]HRR71037.1 phosphatidylglycerophosphatase A [Syntrophorhabdaceae bacterium]HRV21979.1 phosphatidylglycerophosphatase A [Syntrophorhabdaceae bacterium]
MNKGLLFFVTCGFIGYLPFMPGTYASALGCIILYIFPVDSIMSYIFIIICLVALSIICLNRMRLVSSDPPYVVIDEMAGMLVTMVGHRATMINLIAGFILFRFFDIVKPNPIRYVERYKKGYGIMADDILAGVFANICLYIFLFLKGLLS